MTRTAALVLAVLAVLALAACERPDSITAPDADGPSFHIVSPGEPDGAYSLYFVGKELRAALGVQVAQEWEPGTTSTECDPNGGTHDGHAADPTLADALDDMDPATGDGAFAFRRRRGFLVVSGACWFNEWNGAGGFPESAWVSGAALVRGGRRAFAAKLISNGWPEPEHIRRLDVAGFYLDSNGNGLDPSDLLFGVTGELHHEDGTSLTG